MAAGKVKVEILTKLILITIFIVFFIFNYLNDNPSNSLIKIKTTPQTVVVTGGSNAMYGLSALKIKQDLGVDSINLSLPAEGFTFNNYTNWLSQYKIKTHLVIYSPISFWDVKELNTEEPSLIKQIQLLFPKISLLRYVMNLISQVSNNTHRSSNGDLTEYKCNDNIFKWKASNEYIKRAIAGASHFKNRMKAIQNATNAEFVILRIPPLLVTNSDKKIIEPKIKEVIAYYQTQGISVLSENIILSTDETLFCDHAYHPSQTGRIFFTQDLINHLKVFL